VTDIHAGHPYSKAIIPFVNATIRTITFVLFSFLFSRIKKLLNELKKLSITDHLTGLLNSRGLYLFNLEIEIERFRRYRHPFTVVYIDIDNFKQVNDTMGHLAGDEIIKQVACEFKKNLRLTDVIARVGGDEFVFLMRETSSKEARLVMKRLKQVMLKFVNDKNVPITFSYGVATFEKGLSIKNFTLEDFIRTADKLMYNSKRSGKNKITHKIY